MTEWPTWVHPEDPFPEPRPTQSSLSSPTVFCEAVERLWRSQVSEAEVRGLARALGLDEPLIRRKRELPVAAALASEADLVRIATDFDPSAGNHGPDLVLGPLADERLDRRTLQVAVALATFYEGDDAVGSPYRRWLRARPMDTAEVRRGVQAIADAPFAPWAVAWVDGDHAQLRDLLDLGPSVVPPGPVRLRQVARPFQTEVADSAILFSRVAREGDGWVATCPIVVPGPLPVAFPRWLTWVAWSARVRFRSILTRAGLLRRYGHVLCRRVLEHEWVQR